MKWEAETRCAERGRTPIGQLRAGAMLQKREGDLGKHEGTEKQREKMLGKHEKMLGKREGTEKQRENWQSDNENRKVNTKKYESNVNIWRESAFLWQNVKMNGNKTNLSI